MIKKICSLSAIILGTTLMLSSCGNETNELVYIADGKPTPAILEAKYSESIDDILASNDKIQIYKASEVFGDWKSLETNYSNFFINSTGKIIIKAIDGEVLNFDGASLRDKLSYALNTKLSLEKTEDGFSYFVAGDKIIVLNKAKTNYIYGYMMDSKDFKKATKETPKFKMPEYKGNFTENQEKEEVKIENGIVENNIAKKPVQVISQPNKNAGIVRGLNVIKTVYPQNLVEYKTSANVVKGNIFVFSDYTCPYCRKADKKLKEFLDDGYNMIYVLLPRAGEKSKTSLAMTKVLCSDNKEENLQYLFKYNKLPNDIETVENCVANADYNIQMGSVLNITGTPTFINENTGDMTSGFSSVSQTLKELGFNNIKQ